MLLSRLLGQRPAAIQITELADMLDNLGFATASGAHITADSSLRQATVYACVRILSESIAQLPVKLKKRDGDVATEVVDHSAVRLLRKPNKWQTPFEFWQLVGVHHELRGNFYALKNRNGRNEVVELLPLNPDTVEPEQRDDWSVVYNVTDNKTGITGTFPQRDIFHLRNMSSDGVKGLTTINVHREAIGLAIQTEKHGATLFKNGAQVGKVFEKETGVLSDQAYDRLKSELRKYEGAENAHKTLILEDGLKVKTIGMTSEDAQFLETRRFQKQEIASIFGVPMFLLNDTEKSTTWGSGLEQISRAFLQYTLRPRLTRIAQSMARELLSPGERSDHFFEYDTKRFEMGDFQNTIDALSRAIESGILSPNESRDKLGENPREGGDEYHMALNVGGGNESDTEDDA